jgi:hypothetical protein
MYKYTNNTNIKNFLKIIHDNNYNNNIIDYLIETRYDILESNNNTYTAETRYSIYSFNFDNLINNILYHTKFYVPKKDYNFINIISINKLLFLLRVQCKKIKKNKKLEHYAKWYNVLNDIKKHNNIKHPYTIESELLFNNKKLNNYLIREIKGDIIINKKLFNKYDVICNYDEDNDIYYVLDIDIKNMDIINRYIFLRKLHPQITDYEPKKINSFEDFININNNDNIINNNLNWFPKVACIVNDELLNLYNNTMYNNYSVKISLITKNNNYIIKPLNKLSINLLYKNNKWIDNDNNEYFLDNNNIILENNIIYNIIKKNNKLVINKINYWDKYPTCKNIINTYLDL